ncbi:MAG: hydrogenase 4 subunit F [Chloroflexi bacterium]|nr:hydrogenase 4 subunit F [Chloroflexota bacterium]
MALALVLGIPLLTALVCLAPLPRRGLAWFQIAGALGTLAAGLAVVYQVFARGPLLALDGALHVDALAGLLMGVIVVVSFLAALYSVGYLEREAAHTPGHSPAVGWYFAGFHLFVGTMLLTSAVNNLGLLWVAVEATTIVSAPLVGFTRTKAALEAAWKYLILCSVGITFALFGVLLTYYAAVHALGGEASLNWTALMARSAELDAGVMRLAFVFIIIGFGTKAGFAPLHAWLPDAHSQAPSPISALLSGVLLNCALYAILRFHLLTVGAVGPEFSAGLLLGFGLFSVALAVPFLLVQRDVKRLLAYSSMEHIGIIAIAVGIGGSVGLYAGLLHLVNHALAKALLFFVAGNLVQRYGTRRIAAIHGVVQAAPLTGALLLLGTIAITGLPPSGVFLTELGIISAGFGQGKALASAALIGLLALVFAGMFRHVAGMAFGYPSKPSPPTKRDAFGMLAVTLPAAGMLCLGVYVPPPVTYALQATANLLLGGRP